MIRPSRLSSRQRPWILLGLAYGAVVGYLTHRSLPSEDAVRRSWARDAVELIRSDSAVDVAHDTLRWELFGNASDAEVVERFTNDTARRRREEQERNERLLTHGRMPEPLSAYVVGAERIAATNRARIQEIPARRRDALRDAVALWFVPLAMLYVLGLGVDWLTAGLRRSE